MANVLVTGGAGFIGSHIVDELVRRGHKVRVLDLLVPQVHGGNAVPQHLPSGVEFLQADVTKVESWRAALQGVSVVFHKAAEVGVGQSMYEIERYVRANTLGTAILLQELASGKYKVEKLVVASSMSVYGEGSYMCPACGPVYPDLRPLPQLLDRCWEMRCPHCGQVADAVPTSEDKPLHPTSIYAITKRDQEEMCLVTGRAYGIPTVALRYFNVYGTRQSLSNPYTGVAAIFSSRLLQLRSPSIFEDGEQSRDFTHVSDIVQANMLAMEQQRADYEVFNVGTGRQISILSLALELAQVMGVDIQSEIVGKFREGDIRHCYADISKAKRLLGYRPRVQLEDGISDLVRWVKTQNADDFTDKAREELELRGLTK